MATSTFVEKLRQFNTDDGGGAPLPQHWLLALGLVAAVASLTGCAGNNRYASPSTSCTSEVQVGDHFVCASPSYGLPAAQPVQVATTVPVRPAPRPRLSASGGT